MIIALIAAHDPDLVIGNRGKLPWHIPEDLAHFKKRTMDHSVIMGRGVFEEIGERPLPGRRNIVLSSTRRYDHVETCSAISELAGMFEKQEKVYIIGGARVYHFFLPYCQRLEISLIPDRYEGDTFFPEYRHQIGSIWKQTVQKKGKHALFVDYERISVPEKLPF